MAHDFETEAKNNSERDIKLMHRYRGPGFEEKKHPGKDILFGQNLFARDDIKRRIYIESREMPDGILVKYQDILAYELIRDGKTIAGSPTGSAGAAHIEGSNEGDAAGKTYCNELQLKITVRNKVNPIIIMPFIYFTIKSETDYLHALNAAQEIVQILEGILLQRTEGKAKRPKTSLDA